MRATHDAYERTRQRVAANNAVEGCLRGVWARQGLDAELIDTLLAPLRRVHAADEWAVRAYERRLAPDGINAALG